MGARPSGGVGGLLTVHAHPDDETLANGALLATWAASGRPVTVVTCTRGEQGEVIGDALAHLEGDGPALAAHREAELAGALTALGVTDHVFLDELDRDGRPVRQGPAGPRYADSGMSWARAGQATAAPTRAPNAFVDVPVQQAAQPLAALIRRVRPDVVVCDEPGGGYGHPDHVHAHAVAMQAVALAEDPEAGLAGHRVPVALWSAQEERSLRAAYAAIAQVCTGDAVLTVPDPAGPLPSAAVPADRVCVAVPVLPVLRQVAAALRSHATQVQAVQTSADLGPSVRGTYALSNQVLLPLLAEESYRCAPGAALDAVPWPAGVRVPAVAGGAPGAE